MPILEQCPGRRKDKLVTGVRVRGHGVQGTAGEGGEEGWGDEGKLEGLWHLLGEKMK